MVPGHTSIEHKWFKESAKADKNEYTNRYVWNNSNWETMENMQCIRGMSERDACCAVNFFTCQPSLNYGFYNVTEPWQHSYDSPEAKEMLEELKNIMHFWLSMGCDGFRVDMAFSLVKNDPDSIGTIALWQNVREFLDKEFPEAAIVSEWGEPDKSLISGFHMDFLYIDVFNSLIDNREEIILLIEKTVERLMDTTAIDKRLFMAKNDADSKLKTAQEYMALNGKVVINQNEYNEKFDKLMEIYQVAENEYAQIKREKTELMDRCKRCNTFITTLRNNGF